MRQSISRDLEDLFGNLLDNARKWAKSRVLMSVNKNDGAIEVVVEDDGPGIPTERIEDVIARGTQAGQNRARDRHRLGHRA